MNILIWSIHEHCADPGAEGMERQHWGEKLHDHPWGEPSLKYIMVKRSTITNNTINNNHQSPSPSSSSTITITIIINNPQTLGQFTEVAAWPCLRKVDLSLIPRTVRCFFSQPWPPSKIWSWCILKTSQELRMLSSVTINCQITKIVMNSGSQLSEL